MSKCAVNEVAIKYIHKLLHFNGLQTHPKILQNFSVQVYFDCPADGCTSPEEGVSVTDSEAGI